MHAFKWEQKELSVIGGTVNQTDVSSTNCVKGWRSFDLSTVLEISLRRFDDGYRVEISFWAKPRQTPQHISLRPFGLRKPQKVPKEVFDILFQLSKSTSDITISGECPGGILGNIKVSDLVRLSEKYMDTSFKYFLRFSKPKWSNWGTCAEVSA